MNRRHLLCVVSLYASTGLADPLTVDQVAAEPTAKIESKLASTHPSIVYAYAARLFKEGRRDEAVKWFYVGQLRLRFHIAANPGMPRDRDPALLASLNSTVGKTINEWAGGAPVKWASAIDEALRWDAENENSTTSKEQHPAVLQGQRAGLERLMTSILVRQEEIRTERKARGLEVRE